MAVQSRRGFLQRASVATGAVALAAVVGTEASAQAEAESAAPAHDGSFVAWIKDARTGEIAVLVGEHELVITDKALARRLAQAAAKAGTSLS